SSILTPPPPASTPFPYTTLFRSRCTVRRAPLDAVLPRERGDVHDGAGARVQHGLEERPRDEVERADVHPHRRVPVLERELHEGRSEEHTSELQSLAYLVCRLLLE